MEIEIKEKLDSHRNWLVFFGVLFFCVIFSSTVLIANLYDKTSDSLEVIENLQEEGWALALVCIDWDSDYCNELIAYNISGSLVYQPRGTFEEDCNQYCIEQSIRRIKFSLS